MPFVWIYEASSAEKGTCVPDWHLRRRFIYLREHMRGQRVWVICCRLYITASCGHFLHKDVLG